MRWVSGVVIVGGVGMAGWGWWLERQKQGTGHLLYPLLALYLMFVIAAVLRRRRDDIRIGLAAWRERPVVLSVGALAWATAPPCTVLLTLLLRDWAQDVPAGSHFSKMLANRPFTWFFGTQVVVTAIFFAVMGPWLTDLLSRSLRYQRRLTRLQKRGEQEALSREVLKLGEELAERPYRDLMLVSLLLRLNTDRPNSEIRESLLLSLARIPRMEEPGWLSRLSPRAADLKMRLFFADALLTEYYRTDALPHLDAAVRILEGLHRRPPVFASREGRALTALFLAAALGARHSRHPVADRGDLDRALTLAEQAADTLPADATGEITGELLLKHYDRHAEAATLDRAIEMVRPAGPSPVLIWALVLRHRTAGNADDLAEAAAAARDLTTVDRDGEQDWAMLLFTAVQEPQWWAGPTRDVVADLLDTVDTLPDVSPTLSQMSASVKAVLAMDENNEMALSWYEHALTVMTRSASLGLSLDDRRAVLGKMIPSPTGIADIALSMGQVERAVELLELGRTVIWSQIRRLRRTEPPPRVAARLAEIRAALDQPDYPRSERDDLLAGHHAAGTRAELGAEWEKLTNQHGLVRRMSYSECREAARGGPVVIVNVSDQGCAAVIVLADRDPVHVRLPDADCDELASRATGLLTHTTRGMNTRVLASLLWDTIAAPILEAVEPYLGPDRRIWWCPTGPLSAVPLHLAGHHDREHGPALIDHVVSSYTPSLWALLDARRTGPDAATPAPPSAMLVASLRKTPDPQWLELEHAEEEAAIVASRFPASKRLAEQRATVAATRAALADHSWVHIACHGDQSGLVLHDGRLGLDELAGMDLMGERLAFLSACVTALPDAWAVDEVLHPAAAFHLNGFSHVIGTMWEILSSDGPAVADDFYRLLVTERCGPAVALHHAQRRLRAAAPDNPARWAPFVHIGP